MKCYAHPIEEAVGVCSTCGKGLCSVCARTVNGRIFCEQCSRPLSSKTSNLKQIRYIGTALGWLGAINILFIGVYVALYCFHAAVILEGNFQTVAYIVVVLTALSAFTLGVGGFFLWRGYFRKGGVFNLAAGVVTILIYGYFIVNIPLLRRFGILGAFLCVPAFLSGILGFFSGKFFKQ